MIFGEMGHGKSKLGNNLIKHHLSLEGKIQEKSDKFKSGKSLNAITKKV